MARKNNNAGQPNRAAQMVRRAERRVNADRFKDWAGPGNHDLSPQAQPREVQTRVKVIV